MGGFGGGREGLRVGMRLICMALEVGRNFLSLPVTEVSDGGKIVICPGRPMVNRAMRI